MQGGEQGDEWRRMVWRGRTGDSLGKRLRTLRSIKGTAFPDKLRRSFVVSPTVFPSFGHAHITFPRHCLPSTLQEFQNYYPSPLYSSKKLKCYLNTFPLHKEIQLLRLSLLAIICTNLGIVWVCKAHYNMDVHSILGQVVIMQSPLYYL